MYIFLSGCAILNYKVKNVACIGSHFFFFEIVCKFLRALFALFSAPLSVPITAQYEALNPPSSYCVDNVT